MFAVVVQEHGGASRRLKRSDFTLGPSPRAGCGGGQHGGSSSRLPLASPLGWGSWWGVGRLGQAAGEQWGLQGKFRVHMMGQRGALLVHWGAPDLMALPCPALRDDLAASPVQ